MHIWNINVKIIREFQSNESRLSATRNQIMDEYLTKSQSCDKTANDWFKSVLLRLGKASNNKSMWEIRDCLKHLFNVFSKTNNFNLLGDVCGKAWTKK